MSKSYITRRGFIEGGVGLTIANLIPGTTRGGGGGGGGGRGGGG
jgi:hypothetical protein